MTSQTGKKIRLVKCPKCLQILQEDEDVPVYQCGSCSAILQAKRRNIALNSTPSAEEAERVQGNDPETNKLSIESTEKELGDLELPNEDETTEIQQQQCSLDDFENNQGENTLAEAGASSRSLSVHHVVATRASNSSDTAKISPHTPSLVEEKQINLSFLANRSLQLEGPGGFLGKQGRRYVTEQLRPNIPFYPKGMRPMKQHEYHPRWSHEIVSDHRPYRHAGQDHELQAPHLKERERVAKRHVCPTAGGAPFINCYSCSENLQLPLDFLVFKKKHHHLLKCGTCTTVLRFSLQSNTHLVPAVTHDNSTSESPIDKDDEASSSPLHRLMGYSTVSQVFKASQRHPTV